MAKKHETRSERKEHKERKLAACGRIFAALLWLASAITPEAATARADRPAGEALTANDFAYGHSVELPGSRALQTVLLPIDVYRGSVEPRLADLRVFNAHGEAVPHALRGLDAPEPQQEITPPLPLFRLPEGGPQANWRAGDEEIFWLGKGRYRVDAKISEKEATLHLESGRPGTPPSTESAEAEAEPKGYLIDTSSLDRAVAGLELELADGPKHFVVPVRVKGTDDLVHFEQVVGRAAIARLDQAGHRLEVSRIAFAPAHHRYLEITWPIDPLPVELLSVRALLAPESPPLQRRHARVTGRSIEGEPRSFLFDLGGEVPVDRIQVDLPQSNTVVEAQLYSGHTPEGPWARHFDGLLYELEYQSPLRNPAIASPVTRHRYCKLAVSSKGGGVGTHAPVLDAAWRPEQLVFVTRGQAPFTLVYGRAGAPESAFDFEALLAITRTREDELLRDNAILGQQRSFADPSVLEPRAQELAARTIMLWGVLIASVALVVGMSVRLARNMR
jgi:hypothetical protein